MSRKKLLRSFVAGAKLVFTPIAFLFIGWFAWQSKEMLPEVFSKTHWFFLVSAGTAWALSHFLSPLFYVQVFRSCGYNLGYRSALTIHTRYLPAKYLPGGVWHTVGRVAEFRSLGIEAKSIAVFVFLENLLAVAITFFIGAFILCVQKGWMFWGGGMLLVFVLAGGTTLAGFFIVNTRLLKGEEGFSIARYFSIMGTVTIFWFFTATAFVLYIAAISVGLTISPAVETAGIYLFSWGVGYVSLFAPQGVGVFETVASMLLDSKSSMTALVVVVAGFRVVVLVADMAVYSVVKLNGYIGLKMARAINANK